MKCKTCNFYKKDTYIRKGICIMISPEFSENKNCLAKAICFSEAIDGELLVDENFGCILHETKEGA